MIVGCYSTDLYCDYPDADYAHRGSGDFPGPGMGQFTGRTFASTKRKAIKAGWHFTKDRRVLCPWCAQKGRKLKKGDEF